jgi:hypothetical protein
MRPGRQTPASVPIMSVAVMTRHTLLYCRLPVLYKTVAKRDHVASAERALYIVTLCGEYCCFSREYLAKQATCFRMASTRQNLTLTMVRGDSDPSLSAIMASHDFTRS